MSKRSQEKNVKNGKTACAKLVVKKMSINHEPKANDRVSTKVAIAESGKKVVKTTAIVNLILFRHF